MVNHSKFFKSLAWQITIGLHHLVSFLNEILNSIITFGGILDDKKVVELSNAMTPVSLSLMTLKTAVIGFMIKNITKNQDNKRIETVFKDNYCS